MEMNSYSPDYFSLEDILATQERVPFTANVDLPKLGFLDPSRLEGEAGSSSLKSGTALELPYWMVWSLRSRGRIEVGLPKAWQPQQRQIVSADPNVVDLQKLGPHFYEFGRHLIRLLAASGSGSSGELEEVSNLLLTTFMRRFRNIMDASCNSDTRDTLGNTETLDQLERSLYFKGQLAMKHQAMWSARRTDNIKASKMVVKHRKRKADVLSE